MNKPTKEQFQTTVTGYLNDTVSWAETFDIVDDWTSYYQTKFWTTVQDARAVA